VRLACLRKGVSRNARCALALLYQLRRPRSVGYRLVLRLRDTGVQHLLNVLPVLFPRIYD